MTNKTKEQQKCKEKGPKTGLKRKQELIQPDNSISSNFSHR